MPLTPQEIIKGLQNRIDNLEKQQKPLEILVIKFLGKQCHKQILA